MQCFAVWRQRGDDRYVSVRKFGSEAVFFQYGLVAPASWPIKLCDYWRLTLDANLIDAILIAIQGQESPIATKAEFSIVVRISSGLSSA